MEELTVCGITESDEVLATIICRLPPLKKLEIGSEDFGPLCFRHLQERLFGSLKTLDLSRCYKFTGQMALRVLSSCPQLEDFGAPYISVQDLRAAPQPWVCQGLKRLSVLFFDNDEPGTVSGDDLRGSVTNRSSSLVFGYLSKLEQLDTLDISFYNMRTPIDLRFINLNAPQFRLDTGLGQLATLKKLKALCLDRTKQNLREEDVEWMLLQWPKLKKLSGALSWSPSEEDEGGENSIVDTQLSKLVLEKGISRDYYSYIWS
ncbi:hypothetical protein BGZ95_009725 [Linnemannia exigua]|uniref:Uncharacterized protein n=1 Tax=Linnemannia exigua TaxID=604196 RepID=A0AAD4H5G6_9FUNG|nr:hypothetical protein BGZ95_009725 [Linnemannia exigua]